jgi:hypothetical protein
MFGFPERYCRVVASIIEGDDAFVLLDTGSDGRAYLYGVQCLRTNGRWIELGSSNCGGGWSQCGTDPLLGMLTVWDEAPFNADAVRVEFDGAVQEVAVKDGAYLATWWRVPCPALEDGPRVASFRIDGRWT